MNQKETFSKYYNDLNPEQKLAVDTIEGPVMVIAGPGTGKTQILGARIGKILLDTDTDPGSILCLTYTDAGAIAMRRRLTSFIGADAYKVNIYTFHAFCNDIIQDNLFHFEKNSLDPISELEQIQLLRELVDGFPEKHSLKRYRSDAYYEVKNLRSLFSTMKREGYTAAFLEEHIDQYLADLPRRNGCLPGPATGIRALGRRRGQAAARRETTRSASAQFIDQRGDGHRIDLRRPLLNGIA